MSVIQLLPERRRQRSSNTYEAIRLQLEYILEQHELCNFTLGDSRGLVLGYAGRADDAHVLAAYAPVVAKCVDKDHYYDVLEKVQNFIPGVTASSIAFRTFEVDGEILHLCIHGQEGKLYHANVYRAVSGVRRILDESRIAA